MGAISFLFEGPKKKTENIVEGFKNLLLIHNYFSSDCHVIETLIIRLLELIFENSFVQREIQDQKFKGKRATFYSCFLQHFIPVLTTIALHRLIRKIFHFNYILMYFSHSAVSYNQRKVLPCCLIIS